MKGRDSVGGGGVRGAVTSSRTQKKNEERRFPPGITPASKEVW